MITTLLLTSALLAATPAQDDVLIDIDHGGLDALLTDDKDAGLRLALRMAPVRIAELVSVMDDLDFPPKTVFLLARLFDGRTRFTFGRNPDPDAPFPFYARVALAEDDAAGAFELGRGVHAFFVEAGAPTSDVDAEGWHRVEGDVAGWYGARGSAFELHLAARTDPPPPMGDGVLPEGARVGFAMQADVGGLIHSIGGFAELDLPRIFKTILGGRLRYVVGADDERFYENITLFGAAKGLGELGLIGPAPLGERTLKLLPRDTTWASAFTFEPELLLGMLEELVASEGIDLVAEIEAELERGFDLELDVRQLVGALGHSGGVFASDTTGGGGWLSTVAFVRLAEPQSVDSALRKLTAAANALLAHETEGYVQFRTWTHADQEYHALTFPGLPVPLEPTLAILGDVLLIGATPQAAVAAVAQANSGTTSVLDHPGLLAQLAGDRADLADAHTLGFLDSPRMLRSGYGMASLALSALVNGTRSRPDSPVARDAGVILPPYAELADGALCWVELTRVRDGDVVILGTADRSMTVNLAAFLGLFGEPLMAMSVPAALAWTTGREVASKLEMAQDGKVRADLLTIDEALTLYTITNGGQYPDSLEALVRPDANGRTYLDRTDVPRDPWGYPYVYFAPRGEEPFRLLSRGADGAPGGEGQERDITLEEAKRR